MGMNLLIYSEISNSLITVSDEIEKYFEIKSEKVDNFAIVYPAIFGIFAIPSLFFPQVLGLRNCMIIGSFFNLLGSAFRLVSFSQECPHDGDNINNVCSAYYVCLTGNIIVAISASFHANLPSIVSNEWFPSNQRTSFTTYIVNGDIVGDAFGFFLSPVLLLKVNELLIIKQRILIVTIIETSLCLVFGFELF